MRQFLLIFIAILVASCSHNVGQTNTSKVNGIPNVAVKGYDVIAYFTDKKPIKGKTEFIYQDKGISWFFSSEENLEKFKKDPKKYAPKYGGYCAFGVAIPNKKIDIDPKSWYVKDEVLYLNYTPATQKVWLSNLEDNIEKGDENWKELRKQ